ncbi:MAG: CHASE2 domain-containing protein [Syntrophomonas sp.]
MSKKIFTKANLNYYLIGSLIIFFMVCISVKDPLNYLERKTVDWRMKALDVKVDKNIVLVGITEEDIKIIGPLPWSRNVHAQAIQKLTELKPATVGYNVSFPGLKGNSEDDNLVTAAQDAGNIIFPVYAQKIEETGGLLTGSDFIASFDELNKSAAALGHNTFTGDPDTVVRRFAPALRIDENGSLDSFSLAVYKHYKNIKDESIPAKFRINYGQHSIPVDEKGLTTIMFAYSPGTFKIIPFHKLLSGEIDKSKVAGKIVLVGAASPGVGYYYNAPGGEKMSELEFHANVMNTIISGRFFREAEKSYTVATIVILGAITALLFSLFPPVLGFVLLLAVCIIYGAICFYASYQEEVFLELITPLLSIFLIYAASVIYGYVLEMKEKRKVVQTFGRYVAPQVVDEILRYGEFTEVKSKKQVVTVLFVDLSGFTPLSESLPPEQLVGILNEYLRLIIEIIYKYEGTIDKFIGDAVMVVFNAPILVERHEFKAVAAALEIQSELEKLSRKFVEEFGREIKASIGINTGEVIIGNIGALNRVEYAAIGDNVNTASRLQSLAKGGQIIISSSTYQAIKNDVAAVPLGEHKVKGKEKALEVYQVDCIRKN